ncbi:MAG: DUF1846 domain-containing protein [Oscillospiraceae bacterium]|nr:DUF1846 domain-containing protein [Oscillospiraceae bacterium]
MYTIGFDNKKYLKMQSENINERIKKFDEKLYLEFGGKLFDDFHASRVLPGFEMDSKVRLLTTLKEKAEIVLVINSSDIENNKTRGDSGITYDSEVLRLIDGFRERGLYVGSVVITQYSGQTSADIFKEYLEDLKINVYRHYPIPEYPTNIPYILGPNGFGKNDYIATKRPLVIITAPGPGGGKMATCLSQVYHENLRGIKAGYAKFETFPIWNLPLNHPVNIAYEAATVDLNDINMIDPFHLETYGKTAVSYNRDIEVFPILNEVFKKFWGDTPYKSPTDMGVNMAGNCIIDDDACAFAAKQEIIRRYYRTQCNVKMGKFEKSSLLKLELLMNHAKISAMDRPVIKYALDKSTSTNSPSVAIELPSGIVTGKTSSLLSASAAAILNALKTLAGIADKVHLISPFVIEPIQKLKQDYLRDINTHIYADEVLIALSICAATNPIVTLVLEQLPKLKNCEVHSSVILSQDDANVFKNLGMNVTCEPKFQSDNLYHKR